MKHFASNDNVLESGGYIFVFNIYYDFSCTNKYLTKLVKLFTRQGLKSSLKLSFVFLKICEFLILFPFFTSIQYSTATIHNVFGNCGEYRTNVANVFDSTYPYKKVSRRDKSFTYL